MLKLFWHCLDANEVDQKFVERTLYELKQLLKNPPAEIGLDAEPLYQQSAELVCSELRNISLKTDRPFALWCASIRPKLSDLKGTPLLIYSNADSVIAKAAEKENNLAKWGLMNDQFAVSAVYKLGNKYILWHEALHLFDACDCYCYANPNAGPNCELSNCIMQYIPTKKTVGGWPFLCQKNIKRIQAWSKKHKLNDLDGKD